MWNKKVAYIYLKASKAMHKDNPRTHLPQQNKKACWQQ